MRGTRPNSSDIATIADIRWNNEGSFHKDEPGFCKSATLEEIREHNHVLTPGRYVGAAVTERNDVPFEERFEELKGTQYPAFRPDVVGSTEIAVPDEAVITSFSALVSPLVDLIENNEREEHPLAQSPDLLIPKLMSGEIRLREAGQALGAVA